MKQLFIALVLTNLGFAVLQMLFGTDEVQAAPTVTANVETLVAADLEALGKDQVAPQAAQNVSSEADVEESEKAAKGQKAKGPQKLAAAQIPNAGESSCSIAGPFPEENEASDLVNQLADLDIESEVQPRDITLLPDYMVYVGPQSSPDKARALKAEFAALSIDSHVIGRGNLQNALSLGVFSQAPFADNLLSELREQGYEANIATMSLKRRGFQVKTSLLPKSVRSRLIAADTPVIDCPSAVLTGEAVAAVN